MNVDPNDLRLKKSYLAHGSLNFLAFGVFFPLAIIAVKVLRSYTRQHVLIHAGINVVGWILATIAVIIAYAQFKAMDTMHARIGTTVMILVWLQPFAAFLRPKVGTLLRPYWFIFHWLFGTGIIILGWANIFFGIDIYRGTGLTGKATTIYILYGVWIGILGLIILFLDKIPQLREQSRGESGVGHSSMTNLKAAGAGKETRTGSEMPAGAL